jgi:hypothetical protein
MSVWHGPPLPNVEKTSAWTDEERHRWDRQRAVDSRDAWQRDGRGHALQVKATWQDHICPEYEHCSLCVDEAWNCGAAVLGGLIGLGTAIRDREWYCVGCDTIITSNPWECSMGCGGKRP